MFPDVTVHGSSIKILKSYVCDIGTLHSRGHTPVFRHPNTILVAPRTFQAMKIQNCNIHLLRPFHNAYGSWETLAPFCKVFRRN